MLNFDFDPIFIPVFILAIGFIICAVLVFLLFANKLSDDKAFKFVIYDFIFSFIIASVSLPFILKYDSDSYKPFEAFVPDNLDIHVNYSPRPIDNTNYSLVPDEPSPSPEKPNLHITVNDFVSSFNSAAQTLNFRNNNIFIQNLQIPFQSNNDFFANVYGSVSIFGFFDPSSNKIEQLHVIFPFGPRDPKIFETVLHNTVLAFYFAASALESNPPPGLNHIIFYDLIHVNSVFNYYDLYHLYNAIPLGDKIYAVQGSTNRLTFSIYPYFH